MKPSIRLKYKNKLKKSKINEKKEIDIVKHTLYNIKHIIYRIKLNQIILTIQKKILKSKNHQKK